MTESKNPTGLVEGRPIDLADAPIVPARGGAERPNLTMVLATVRD